MVCLNYQSNGNAHVLIQRESLFSLLLIWRMFGTSLAVWLCFCSRLAVRFQYT
jgi:hypothetical protein